MSTAGGPWPSILPPPHHPALVATAVESLAEDRCWALLPTAHIGRLAILAPDGSPDIFPMDYRVHDRRLFVRSEPGTKLQNLVRTPTVALEAEGLTDDGFLWSVVVRGNARRLDADDEIEASGVLELRSTSPTTKDDFVEIAPKTVTGRSFRPQR